MLGMVPVAVAKGQQQDPAKEYQCKNIKVTFRPLYNQVPFKNHVVNMYPHIQDR